MSSDTFSDSESDFAFLPIKSSTNAKLPRIYQQSLALLRLVLLALALAYSMAAFLANL